MTREEAREALRALAQAAVSPTLTDDELDAALTASRLPDSEGRPPADPDYVEENWDINYAAAECMEMKYLKQTLSGTVTKFSSEGSSFEKKGPDYLAAAEWFRDQSTAGSTGDGVVIVALEGRDPWWMRPRSEWPC